MARRTVSPSRAGSRPATIWTAAVLTSITPLSATIATASTATRVITFITKPQISLNHIWQIDYKSSLSTSVYVSFATGGGYSGQGHGTYNGTSLSNTSWYGASQGVLSTLFRCADGTFDYAAIQEMNENSTTGSNMIMSSSNNDHEWYGIISTYKNEFIPKTLAFTGGIDVRYYIGHHNNKIVDLYDGEYYMNYENRASVKP